MSKTDQFWQYVKEAILSASYAGAGRSEENESAESNATSLADFA